MELEALLGSSRQCACGRRHEVGTRRIILGPGAVAELPSAVTPLGASALLLADPTTYEVAGVAAERLLRSAGLAVSRETVVPGRTKVVEASAELAEELHGRAPAVEVVVAVGSGTISDLGKLLAAARGLPLVTVATAPSMNGYPSTIAAVLQRGVKRTLPVPAPVAIVADTDTMAAAPHAMIAAGLADLLAKCVSAADWKLAHLLRGEYFCGVPVEVVAEAEQACFAAAERIGRGEPAAVAQLTEGLLLSGISMAMAGSSAPASGGEHLISHYWDMTASAYGLPHNLHGAQVGLGALICSALYECLRERELGGAALRRAAASAADPARLARQHLAPLVGTAVAEEIAQEAAAKQAAKAPREDLWEALAGLVRPGAELRAALQAARASVSAEELGIPAEAVRNAVRHGRLIRNRYTVLDLAADLGVLDDLVEEVLERSGVGG